MKAVSDKQLQLLPLSPRAIGDYFFRRITPARIVLDRWMEIYVPGLDGKVLELGSGDDRRRRIAGPDAEYILSNISPKSKEMVKIDATAISMDDGTLDAVVSEVMIEHVFDPFQVVREIHRVLRPGGTLIIVIPWMYPFHAAPDDYFRLSKSGVQQLLSEFEIERLDRLGSLWLTISQFLQLRAWPWSLVERQPNRRLIRCLPTLLLGWLAYLLSQVWCHEDEYALLYCAVARKRVRSL